MTKPFLKWAGSKTQLMPKILPLLPQSIDHYYEPFLGSAALFLRLNPPLATISDLNGDLINVYIQVRDNCEELIALLAEHKHNHHLNPKEYYYSTRSLQSSGSPLEQAARFIYLNKTCFNGLYRTNRSGEFNVPMGKYANPPIWEPDKIRNACLRLHNVEIIHCDYRKALVGAKRGDFVFLDPPYAPIKSDSFTAYTPLGFDAGDQRLLRDLVDNLTLRGVSVMVTNSDTDLIWDLYSRYQINSVRVKRMISSDVKTRNIDINELIITNY